MNDTPKYGHEPGQDPDEPVFSPYDKYPGRYALGTDQQFRTALAKHDAPFTTEFPDEPFPVGTVVMVHGLEGTAHQRLRSTGDFHPVTGGKPMSYDDLRNAGNVVVLMFGKSA